MAEVVKDKFDLITMAIKQQLIGTKIHFEGDDVLTVKDFYIDFATSELHIEWEESVDGVSLSLKQKYVVTIPDTYKSVKSKKKKKKAKKKK